MSAYSIFKKDFISRISNTFLTRKIIFVKSKHPIKVKKNKRLDILAFGAHPDDVELGCAGTLIAQVKNNKTVGIIDLTKGELGTRGSVQTRKKEAEKAAKIIGASLRENLGFKDGFIDSSEKNLKKVIRIIRMYRPHLVLCNAPKDRHPDHKIASELVRRACFLSGLKKIKTSNLPAHRPKMVLQYIQDFYLQPTVILDVSHSFSQKMEAIKAFKTQFYDPKTSHLNPTPISGKSFLAHLKGRAISLGRLINTQYAEGFIAEKPVGCNDVFNLIFIVLFCLFLYLSFLVSLFLKVPVVQSWALKKASTFISQKIDTEVSLGEIQLDLIQTLRLNDLLIKDAKQDTLIYIKHIRVNALSDLEAFKNLNFSHIEAQKGVVKIVKYPFENAFNIESFIQKLSQKNNPSTSQTELLFKSINVQAFKVLIDDQTDSNKIYPIHFSALNINTNLKIDSSANIHLNVAHLSAANSLLSEITSFNGQLLINSTHIKGEKLHLKTLFSDIESSGLEIELPKDTSDLKLETQIQNALVSSKDLNHFLDSIINIDVKLNTWLSYENSSMQLKKTQASLLDHSRINGDIYLSFKDNFFGYSPNIDLSSHVQDVLDILSRIDSNNALDTHYINKLSFLNYKGNLSFTNHFFENNGVLTSKMGRLENQNKITFNKESLSIQSKLNTDSFLIGQFTNDSLLKQISTTASLTYRKQDKRPALMTIQGAINKINYKNYTYSNIWMDGHLENESFSGLINIKDPNLSASFNGQTSLTGSNGFSDHHFDLDIQHFNPIKTNLLNSKKEITLSAKSTINIQAKDLNQWNGQINLSKLSFQDKDTRIDINDIAINRTHLNNNHERIEVTSDLLNASFRGRLQQKNIQNHLTYLYDFIKSDTLLPNPNPSIQGQVNINNIDSVMDFFKFSMSIAPLSRLSFNLSNDHPPIVHSQSSYIEYDSILFTHLDLKTDTSNLYSLKLKTQKTKWKHHEFESVAAHLKKASNKTSNSFNIKGEYINYDHAAFLLESTISQKDSGFHIHIHDPSYIRMRDEDWTISSKILGYKNDIYLDYFDVFLPKKGSVHLAGKHKSNQTILSGAFKEVPLGFIKAFFNSSDLEVQGEINGDMQLETDLKKNLHINSDLQFSDLKIDSITTGHGSLQTKWNKKNENLSLNLDIKHPDMSKTIHLNGHLYVNDPFNINLTCTAEQLPLQLLEPYTSSVFSSLSGHADLNIKVKGSLKSPEISGFAELQNTKAEIDYLKSTFYLPKAKIKIKKDYLAINHAKILDADSNTGHLTATVLHENFKKMNYDLSFSSKNMFKALNTTQKDNDLFYGTAFISSPTVNVSGYEKNLFISLSGSTAEESEINFPLSGSEHIETAKFISFISTKDKTTSLKETKENNQDLEELHTQIHMYLDVKDNTVINIIFDEKLGDVIKTRGNGEIKIEYDSKEDPKLFGRYEITKGDYLFTFQNLINKKFKLRKGSSINWTGNPYKGQLDMTASYNLRTSLASLLVNETESDLVNKRIPVECLIDISDDLYSPNIKFNIDLPTIPENHDLKSQFHSLVTHNEDQIRNQFFSLLMLNRFMPDDNSAYASTSKNDATNNLSELVSNQLSNWASKISSDVDVGLNYRPGDQYTQNELELALSTRLLNDRLTLEGNFGVGGSSNIGTEGDERSGSGLIGDFFIEYALNKERNVSVKAYHKSNDDRLEINNSSYTQGVGLVFKKEFNKVKDLFSTWFNKSENPPKE